ncbi:MAG: hypothetical protein RQ842_09600 [Vulcanisaeta sp.]|nr:hypothetical protein [Vulcanisaeta sp.]
MQATYRNQVRVIISVVLVTLFVIALMLPAIAHAMFISVSNGFADGSVSGNTITKAGGSVTVVGNGQVTTVSPNSNGYTVTTTTYNAHAQPVSQTVLSVGPASKYTFTTYNTQTTITKTYTQYVYYTTVINNVITKYMLPVIQWTLTLVNIGQYQAQGYHSLSNTKTFLPGGYGGEIFVPVYSQEAIYAFNIAPSTKPVITGWYVGSQSQYSTTSTSVSKTPPQLASIQQTVDTIKQLATITIPNVTRTTTNWNYIIQPGQNNTIIWTPPPYFYSQADINNAYSTAWNDLVHGDILGAWYQAGRGLYMQTWNFLASAVYSAYKFMQVAKNAFNTATLAKSIGLAFNLHL